MLQLPKGSTKFEKLRKRAIDEFPEFVNPLGWDRCMTKDMVFIRKSGTCLRVVIEYMLGKIGRRDRLGDGEKAFVGQMILCVPNFTNEVYKKISKKLKGETV
ncbi:hypothetical protein TSUD_126230 [Trifolium subterraneum]|uniref:Uncharacterized protein n=1 Tax=Trifolium subterraneum TaxID=3900 RepID=A0A2Z6NE00_TRISU|nr:hypothetical protein TSUD_126230 [Trifolium subterraneum]